MKAWPLVIGVLLLPSSAQALPRFAARVGAECTLCHVSPSGGGVRNRYGSHVFQQTMLPLSFGDEDDATESEPLLDGLLSRGFSGQVTEWLSVGSDLRLAYLFVKPERSPIPDTKPDVTSSFFLMQADLYAAAKLGPHLTTVLDLGAYGGFEAWLLLKAREGASDSDLYLKVGHFLPAFGIRDVNHDLFTRGVIGLGATDRDTGVEATALAGPFSLSLALVNGTFADQILDSRGEDHRSFEKALVSRAAVRALQLPWLKAQIGGSFYYNDNVERANPLFSGQLSEEQEPLSAAGVNELRVGVFMLASLGRFGYLGDVVYVSDRFADATLDRLRGYASYQELDVRLFQGLELSATFEFMDPNTRVSGNSTLRFGLAAELFPTAFFEVRAMARHALSDGVFGDTTDVLIFAHAFF